MCGTQRDTQVSYTGLHPWLSGIFLKQTDMRKKYLMKTKSTNMYSPRHKTLCSEWKQAYEVRLLIELLQLQPKRRLMSQLFHSNGECICSLCMHPKWQWLTLQGVKGGRALIPVGQAAMLTPLPSLSHRATHPPLTKPRSLRHDHDATAMSPLFYDPETTHTANQLQFCGFNPTPKFSKFCLFFSPPVSAA